MLKGIILTLCACFIWGFIFVIPLLLTDFTSLEITLGRYFFFGSISMFIFGGFCFRKLVGYPLKFWRKALTFGLVANIFYYIATVVAIKYSSPGITALVAGIGPVSIAFYGNFKQRECRFSQLIIPSILIAIGLVIIKIQVLAANGADAFSLEHLVGIFCSFLALAFWTWFVVSNNRFLKNNPSIAFFEWSTMIGVTTFGVVAFTLIFLRLFIWDDGDLVRYSQFSSEMQLFLVATAILGFFCSWLGSFLWNTGSTKLPVSFGGQLTIFETLFGLMFVYIYEERVPSLLECVGITLMLVAIFYSMRLFTKTSSTPTDP